MVHSFVGYLLIDSQCLQFIPSMSRTQTDDSARLDRTAETSRRHAQTTIHPSDSRTIIMNAKTLIAALSLAVVGNAALAVEAEQFNPAPSTLSRAEVKAELAAAKQTASIVSYGEATVFADAPVAAVRSREDVRAEARAAARDRSLDELYVG
jgi:hypothetical protein